MRFLRLLVIALALSPTSCALLTEEPDETKGWSAEEFYRNAREAIDDGNYETALGYFSKLEARYPYGRYAEQAQLETAYVHYKSGEPAAAIAAADRFIKLHPRHPNVDYAYYLRGLASFDAGKGLFENLFPQEPHKRDPSTARESFRYFKELVTRFPKSKYAGDAIQRMTYLRNNLARYEMYVAEQYASRGAHVAAANRAKYVVENYERTPAIPDALALLVRSYRKMEMPRLAEDSLRVLELNFPDYPGLPDLRAARQGSDNADTSNQ